MSCAFSRKTLALHVEGDLREADAALAEAHLQTCGDCREFLDALRARQSLLKSLRRETVSSTDCLSMRHDVMSIVNDQRHRFGWLWRVERAAAMGFQRRPLAIAAFALIGVLSVSVFGQVRDKRPEGAQTVAMFDAGATLRRPEGYRDWIALERSAGRIYVTPPAYREQARTGQFPEGTMMVWEPAAGREVDRAHRGSSLLVSVKSSSRFDGGWGFFDFTGADGRVTPTAQPLPESSGCRTCHRADGTTDHARSPASPLL